MVIGICFPNESKLIIYKVHFNKWKPMDQQTSPRYIFAHLKGRSYCICVDPIAMGDVVGHMEMARWDHPDVMKRSWHTFTKENIKTREAIDYI